MQAGEVVTFKVNGTTAATATTDGSGNACGNFAAAATDTVTAEVAAGGGYAAATITWPGTSITWTAGSPGALVLPTAAGYGCKCCQLSPPSGNIVAVAPATIYFDDGLGTIPLTLQTAILTQLTYLGFTTRTATGTVSTGFNAGTGHCSGTTTGGTVSVGVQVNCTGGNVFNATMGIATCSTTPPNSALLMYNGTTGAGGQTGSSGLASGSATATACKPLTWSGTMTKGSGGFFNQIYGAGTTFTGSFTE